ncbi:hypothetical protein [Variovorax sp. YR216]|uniref:hypothetical protein n=1 Tax=Variovorax sp. YR216 TaxID=1882828 RepID=UPI000899AE09|nr:hypothetical protein [Variovorax sp. YR216]SEA50051.1 hypothetical protein SAMN05444680_102667 [Variovorax sp. YR216]
MANRAVVWVPVFAALIAAIPPLISALKPSGGTGAGPHIEGGIHSDGGPVVVANGSVSTGSTTNIVNNYFDGYVRGLRILTGLGDPVSSPVAANRTGEMPMAQHSAQPSSTRKNSPEPSEPASARGGESAGSLGELRTSERSSISDEAEPSTSIETPQQANERRAKEFAEKELSAARSYSAGILSAFHSGDTAEIGREATRAFLQTHPPDRLYEEYIKHMGTAGVPVRTLSSGIRFVEPQPEDGPDALRIEARYVTKFTTGTFDERIILTRQSKGAGRYKLADFLRTQIER